MSDPLDLMVSQVLQIAVIADEQEALAAEQPSQPPGVEELKASAMLFAGQTPPQPVQEDQQQAEAAMVLLFAQQLGAHGTLRQVEEDRKRRHEEEKEDSDDE